MELIERAGFLDTLRKLLAHAAGGEGHCVLINGEAGIGKTSLVKAFCNEKKNECSVYLGSCDALFTPRPLAPLYDIALQLGSEFAQVAESNTDRSALFTTLFRELANQPGTKLVVFEDIHWADEATLDFIKFFARRIGRISCLFILTYRNDEVHSNHPLRNVLGQLASDSFTRLQLAPFSKHAVDTMAAERGYNGDEVYSISGGNPFYVTEILASYSPGVPDNVKDAILSVFNRQEQQTKLVWQILSVLPTGFEIEYLEKMAPSYAEAIGNSLDSKILLLNDGVITFKHELYRRTVESSLSPLVRLDLNKKILLLLLQNLGDRQETVRIVHHAKNANEHELVVQYAPLVAEQAAAVGAHVEASRLYYSAIEYYRGNDKEKLIGFFEAYAYECYLTNQIKEAIIFQGRALTIWKEKNDIEKIGNSLRFLSRLWWFDGNRKQAERYGSEAIDLLAGQPPSRSKAMAFSNMSQLKMLSDERAECILWAKKAITMAKELGDEEILCHALNNVGAIYMGKKSSSQKGISLLQQSLAVALKNSYHEHVARAYTNLASNAIKIKEHAIAKNALDAGIFYCAERDLKSWTAYMLSDKAKLSLQTGNWKEAKLIARNLIDNESQAPIVKIGALIILGTIEMRSGNIETALPLLHEANTKAFQTQELQRIIPALVASLEFEWITGQHLIGKEQLDGAIAMAGKMGNAYEFNDLSFWLSKVGNQSLPLIKAHSGYQIADSAATRQAATSWEMLGCPFEQALMLFEGDEADKRKAMRIVNLLGADAVYEKMKREMRSAGIKNIPHGIRKVNRANAANLTGRQIDVLQLLKEGLQNKEIAGRLFISSKTVDHHISSILLKLNVNSRVKAAQEALRLGIVK